MVLATQGNCAVRMDYAPYGIDFGCILNARVIQDRKIRL